MRQRLQRALLPLALLVVFGAYAAVAGCGLVTKVSEDLKPEQEGTVFQEPIPTPAAIGEVWSLPQGWTTDTMQQWWQGTQGSEIVPLAYFLNVEQADSEELFRSDANIRSYRYIPQRSSSWNPDALPVGFAETVDPQTDVTWMGFSCAACHTAQLAYGDVEIRVEGGPTLADYRSFQNDLTAALDATARDDAKFDRFARRVLEGDYSMAAAVELRADLVEVVGNLARRNHYNRSDVRDGYGRIDALGQIFNAVTAYDLRVDDNARSPNAPVSYPFLWGTPQSDVVQWNGSVSNKDGGVGRNVGELTGVFGHVDVAPQHGLIEDLHGYDSSIQQASLTRLEVWVEDLWAPQWPDVFPEVDAALVARGERLFNDEAIGCASCHYTEVGGEPYNPRDDDRRYAARMVHIDTIATDRTVVDNFSGWLDSTAVATGPLNGATVNFFRGPTFGAQASGLEVLTHVVGGVLLRHKGDTIRQLLIDHEGGLIFGPTDTSFRWYKARPLTGIWATAPYLHNGSVPTLYDLLLPPADRPDAFWLGNRAFDPEKVGYVTEAGEDGVGFTYRTDVRGNGNGGHLYGTQLSEDERWALVEYMKTL